MAKGSRTIIEISPKTIFWVLGIGALAFFLYLVRDVLALLIFAIVIASALEPLLEYLKKKRIPRIVSLLAVYIIFFVLFAAFIYILLPLFIQQFQDFSQNYPAYFGKIEAAAGTITFIPGLSGNIHDLLGQLTEQIPSFTSVLSYASSIFGGVVSFIMIIVVSFYLALSHNALDDFLRSILPPQFESYAHELWARAQRKMGQWLQAQILLSFIMATMAGIGLSILGVNYALLIAIAAGVLEIVPFVGATISTFLATLLALSQSPILGLWTFIFFIVILQIEGNVLVPLLIKKLVGLNPVAVILAILVGAKLGGILGVLLAVPIAAVVDEFFDDLARRRSIANHHLEVLKKIES